LHDAILLAAEQNLKITAENNGNCNRCGKRDGCGVGASAPVRCIHDWPCMGTSNPKTARETLTI